MNDNYKAKNIISPIFRLYDQETGTMRIME